MQFPPRDVGLLAVEDVRECLLEQIRAVETLVRPLQVSELVTLFLRQVPRVLLQRVPRSLQYVFFGRVGLSNLGAAYLIESVMCEPLQMEAVEDDLRVRYCLRDSLDVGSGHVDGDGLEFGAALGSELVEECTQRFGILALVCPHDHARVMVANLDFKRPREQRTGLRPWQRGRCHVGRTVAIKPPSSNRTSVTLVSFNPMSLRSRLVMRTGTSVMGWVVPPMYTSFRAHYTNPRRCLTFGPLGPVRAFSPIGDPLNLQDSLNFTHRLRSSGVLWRSLISSAPPVPSSPCGSLTFTADRRTYETGEAVPIDLYELGKKCRRLREDILQMSVDQAATHTGIDAERIRKIEAGRIEPSGDEVLIFADVYNEPVDYFITNEQSASIEKADNLYRMYGESFSPADRQSIQLFLKLCRMEQEIESLLGARPRVIRFEPTSHDGYWKRHGQANAEKLRRDLGLGIEPIQHPFQLPRTFGCHVFRRAIENSNISGVMLRHNDVGPCILINYVDDVYRQNFSVAHELCHALLDHDCDVTVTFERGDRERDQEHRHREWRANSFASHLLFPQAVRESLRWQATSGDCARVIREEASRYHVNPIVVLYALQAAKRLTPQDVKRLERGLKIPRDQKDDGDLAGESSRVRERRERYLAAGLSPEYVALCARAYREGEISLGRLSDALLVSPVELPAVLSELGETDLLREIFT